METTLFSNVNAAIRRDVFDRFRFADDIIMSEDQEWSRRVLLAGFALRYVPDAAVRHSHPYTVRDAFRRFFDSGVSAERAYLAGGAPAQDVVRREAVRYAREEVAWLWRSGHRRWLPYAAVYEGAKFAGLQLGARHRRLPPACAAACPPARRTGAPRMSVCAFVLTRDRKELLVEGDPRAARADAPGGPRPRPRQRLQRRDRGAPARRGPARRPRVRFERREENTGGAGGYDAGLRLAAETGHDWIWLMDDDAEPRPDALERLLASPPAQDPATAGVCTSVVELDGVDRPAAPLPPRALHHAARPEAYEPGRYEAVDCASFVGLMLRTDVVRAVGGVRTEFFIGYDDAEYSLRVWRHGAIRLVPEAEVLHKIPIGGTRADAPQPVLEPRASALATRRRRGRPTGATSTACATSCGSSTPTRT